MTLTLIIAPNDYSTHDGHNYIYAVAVDCNNKEINVRWKLHDGLCNSDNVYVQDENANYKRYRGKLINKFGYSSYYFNFKRI